LNSTLNFRSLDPVTDLTVEEQFLRIAQVYHLLREEGRKSRLSMRDLARDLGLDPKDYGRLMYRSRMLVEQRRRELRFHPEWFIGAPAAPPRRAPGFYQGGFEPGAIAPNGDASRSSPVGVGLAA
jgi:hypothetical protein